MTTNPPAAWHPDPAGSNRLRWWDGQQWTEHYQPMPAPQQQQPPQQPGSTYPQQGQQAGYPQQQAQQPNGPQQGQPQSARGEYSNLTQGYGDQSFGGAVNGPVGHTVAGDRNVFTESTIVVSQKRKLIELTNEYMVYGQDGAEIGAVVQVGQSAAKKALRFVSNVDQFLTHRLEIRDTHGRPLLLLTRPGKVFKSTIIVEQPGGGEIGRLVQQNVFGKIRFGLQVGGKDVGTLNAENWRAWNFALLDADGVEVGRITKTWEGLLTTMFTTADNYVVHIRPDLPDPLRSLAIAAALTVDTALKQDDR
ncbi:scramblase [Flexivirga endophytica]|uniref:Scramblase n=1 Tax=Flexivirga endophytica TaxID=1849103 RepID=A0A916WSQ9_9MICO|nr:phospholipid scramblase-related protein [Flexivirga endophytica]GGB26083.1 scramblase [Flexivirga endophytica]GHB54628.1 scramblase [Flexivirga endophytica]